MFTNFESDTEFQSYVHAAERSFAGKQGLTKMHHEFLEAGSMKVQSGHNTKRTQDYEEARYLHKVKVKVA